MLCCSFTVGSVVLIEMPHSMIVHKHRSIIVSCSGIGYPQPTVKWYMLTDNGTENIDTGSGKDGRYQVVESIRLMKDGSYNVTSNWMLANITIEEDEGMYLCTVSNSINGYHATANVTFNITVWSK